ncbi:hypothetical protein U1Q18_015458 [Sarracenia purpurea var. burkii]
MLVDRKTFDFDGNGWQLIVTEKAGGWCRGDLELWYVVVRRTPRVVSFEISAIDRSKKESVCIPDSPNGDGWQACVEGAAYAKVAQWKQWPIGKLVVEASRRLDCDLEVGLDSSSEVIETLGQCLVGSLDHGDTNPIQQLPRSWLVWNEEGKADSRGPVGVQLPLITKPRQSLPDVWVRMIALLAHLWDIRVVLEQLGTFPKKYQRWARITVRAAAKEIAALVRLRWESVPSVSYRVDQNVEEVVVSKPMPKKAGEEGGVLEDFELRLLKPANRKDTWHHNLTTRDLGVDFWMQCKPGGQSLLDEEGTVQKGKLVWVDGAPTTSGQVNKMLIESNTSLFVGLTEDCHDRREAFFSLQINDKQQAVEEQLRLIFAVGTPWRPVCRTEDGGDGGVLECDGVAGFGKQFLDMKGGVEAYGQMGLGEFSEGMVSESGPERW